MSGAIHRKKKSKDFVTLDTHCLRNKNLKWDAKGLHSYLMQLPEDWKVNIEDLKSRGLDKREGTLSPMRALVSEGYVFRERVADEKGRFAGYDYHLFERPEHLAEFLSVTGKTVDGKTVHGKTVNGKPATTKVLNSLTENNKNEESKGENENPPTPGENPTPVEAKKEKDLVPPPAADLPADPAPDAEPLPLTADCRPNSKTPVDLFSKLQQFYIDNPLEWKDGVLQMAKGSKYSENQRREIVSDFCCYAIKNNQGSNTYQMLNAALQQWFRNQERAESWKGKSGGTSQAGSAAPVYTAPPKGTHQPAYVP